VRRMPQPLPYATLFCAAATSLCRTRRKETGIQPKGHGESGQGEHVRDFVSRLAEPDVRLLLVFENLALRCQRASPGVKPVHFARSATHVVNRRGGVELRGDG
jgi:hypothetical protein